MALDQLVEYRNHLDSRVDGPLISALNRLMNVFQSRLFLALLGRPRLGKCLRQPLNFYVKRKVLREILRFYHIQSGYLIKIE